ncbi:putative lipid-transfer protein DIR1 [Senna tora]|uniref:Putative lipid-transfer protein DIR1 n=1 Tax=Senna tora TaxID=362788 RepID=A0A834XAW8_9FABA|nr:putative lipid-transfer protein DIR1 [Senna tora]
MEAYNSKKLVAMGVWVVIMVIATMSLGSEPKLAHGQGLCRMTKEGLKACKPSVVASGQDPLPPPNAPCCSALSNADLQCLCNFKDSGFLISFYNIDPDKAMALPIKTQESLCKLRKPSFPSISFSSMDTFKKVVDGRKTYFGLCQEEVPWPP